MTQDHLRISDVEAKSDLSQLQNDVTDFVPAVACALGFGLLMKMQMEIGRMWVILPGRLSEVCWEKVGYMSQLEVASKI